MIKRIRKTTQIIFSLSMVALLSSCSEMNSQFDCPMQAGINCESIDSIYARVDRGEIGNAGFSTGCHQHLSTLPKMINMQTCNVTSSYLAKNKPFRDSEKVQKIWIAPFEDKQGNYHQESDIYTVTKPGSWVDMPLKELDVDGE